MSDDPSPVILLVGASRGLGLAMAEEFVARGWRVIGTARGDGRTPLHDLAGRHPGRIAIERLDITVPAEIAALRERLAGRDLAMLFVNAGILNRHPEQTIAEIATDDFAAVMETNVLGAMRAVEGLQDVVAADGTIGIMSSGQGSIANNTNGGFEIYRASKSALNQLMRSYAARHADGGRALVLMAPGWIRTDLGGAGAPLTVGEAMPAIVDTLLAQAGRPGLRYLDRYGETVAW